MSGAATRSAELLVCSLLRSHPEVTHFLHFLHFLLQRPFKSLRVTQIKWMFRTLLIGGVGFLSSISFIGHHLRLLGQSLFWLILSAPNLGRTSVISSFAPVPSQSGDITDKSPESKEQTQVISTRHWLKAHEGTLAQGWSLLAVGPFGKRRNPFLNLSSFNQEMRRQDLHDFKGTSKHSGFASIKYTQAVRYWTLEKYEPVGQHSTTVPR